MTAGRIDRVRAMLRRHEYALLLDRLSNRLLPSGNPVLYWDRFVIVQLDDLLPLRRQSQVEVVPASSLDLEQLCRDVPARGALFRRRVAEGQRCFVIKDDGKITGREWVIGDQPVYATNSGYRFVAPARPALWGHDIYVDPAYRMRGYFVALMLNALRLGVGERPPHLYAEIHHLNDASIRAHESLGFRIVRTVTVVSVLGLKLYFVADERRQHTVASRYAWRVAHI